MNFAVAASVILALAAAPGQGQQPVAPNFNKSTDPALFSLYLSCDLIAEFVTPPVDARAVLLMDTPVSREGARLQSTSRRTPGWAVVRVPLIVEDADRDIPLRSAHGNVIDAPANANKSARAGLKNRGHGARGCGLSPSN
jgi:hypothetical protein